MIKNKTLNTKIIFKNIKNKLKTFQVFKQTIILQNIIKLFSKTIFQNIKTIFFYNIYSFLTKNHTKYNNY